MTDEPGKDLAPRQPQPPAPPVDPEQLRQFQEFQRFQEYQRYQEATGQAPQAPKQPGGKRWWLVVLGSRIFWRALFFLLVISTSMWAYDRYFGVDDPGDIAKESGRMTNGPQAITTPGQNGTVQKFYDDVSRNLPELSCQRIVRDDVRQKFAQAFDAKDCTDAFAKLHAQVKDRSRYEQPIFPREFQTVPTTNKVTIDSCSLTSYSGKLTDAGPLLGTFVVELIGRGWVITDWSPSTCR
ncbi:hypothetical protein [Lentzea sp. NPDC092896]|uniref:hypothetical protein n=1 Tax=Lentzea sp. NPDC092896 TaxID=3364127 RepID=UPI00382191FF